MSKRPKKRQTLQDILASCSDTLFPAEMGEAPVRIDSADVEGDTPLHVMMWRNDTYGAKCLIAAGADVNAVGDMSETPLHVAIRNGNADIISALLEKGANPDAVSEFNQTPRSMAAALGHDNRRLFTNS
jgi:ankyrin repeat protein